jgi:uncharacterized protein (UPF0335 family)
MPTGTCRYPHHHGGPSAGPPIGLLLAIIAGALIITHVHAVVVTLAVVAILAVLGTGVMLLVHSHRSAPYDGAWAEQEDVTSTLSVTAAGQLQARVGQLEREAAERRAIEAPQQHLHIHGVSAEDVAAVIRSQHRAIEED